jgi:hypothetical protein
MKTILIIRNTLISSVAAVALVSLAAASARGGDQPKGGETLVKLTKAERAPVVATPASAVANSVMGCGKCSDRFVSVLQAPEKMGRRPVATVVRHGCSSCETKATIKGEGKAKREIAVHTCSEVVGGHSGCGVAGN